MSANWKVMVFLVCCAIRQNAKKIIHQFDPHAGYSVQKVAEFLNGGPYFRPTGLSTAQLLRWYGRCYAKAIMRNARIIPMVGIIAFPSLYANSNFCFRDALIQYGEFVWRFGSYVVIGMQNQVMVTDIVASIFGYIPTTIEYGVLGIVGASAIEIVPTDRIISYNSWVIMTFISIPKIHEKLFTINEHFFIRKIFKNSNFLQSIVLEIFLAFIALHFFAFVTLKYFLALFFFENVFSRPKVSLWNCFWRMSFAIFLHPRMLSSITFPTVLSPLLFSMFFGTLTISNEEIFSFYQTMVS